MGPEGRSTSPYRGRFAPSPTGPLHAGSIVAALASWLDARAHGGTWLVRIEDTDGLRCPPGMDRHVLWQLSALGMFPDEPVQWQSARTHHYAQALQSLISQGDAYPCGCSRQDVESALAAQGTPRERFAASIYPGTCRGGLQGKSTRAWRLRVGYDVQRAEAATLPPVRWWDRRIGDQSQQVEQDVGDFIVRRADGIWAYQLAVVVDDAQQGITDVVRGEDLADNTPRQIVLQGRLGVAQPRYLHVPLVRAPDGQKLSKQSGAMAVDVHRPLDVLEAAAKALGLDVPSDGVSRPTDPTDPPAVARWLERATECWARRWVRPTGR